MQDEKVLTITLTRRPEAQGWVAFVDNGNADHPGVFYGPEIDANAVLGLIADDIERVEMRLLNGGTECPT